MDKAELVTTDENKQLAPAADVAQLLSLAVEKDIDVDKLVQLIELANKQDDRRARQEFHHALAQFQRDCPPIKKSSVVEIRTSGGAKYSYRYAELDQIARIVNPILSPLGLSYSWDCEHTDQRLIKAICTLRHANGHSESASFAAPADSSAKMSEAQKHAAANTYAKRQALVQVLGLTMCDPDTDAAVGSEETISESQVADLESLISEVGANLEKFLVWCRVESLDKIRASDYAVTVRALEQKR